MVLNEAVVKIRSEGLPKLQTEIAKVNKSLTSIGHSTAPKGLNSDFRNAAKSVSKFNAEVTKADEGLKNLPSGGGFAPMISPIGKASAALGTFLIAAETAKAAISALTIGSVRAAIRVEGFTNAFTALTGSASVAGQEIAALQKLSQLPGVSFEQAVGGAVRLHTVGVEGQRAHAVIREFGNALALVGETDLSGALLGLTQILSRGKVAQEEINQIVERSGLIAAALKDAFGSVLAEDIQANLDETGKSVQDFADILVNSLSKQARVSADSAANSIQNLKNSFFLLQAEVGKKFLPVVSSAAVGLSGFFDKLTNLISGTNEAAEAIRNFNNELRTSDSVLKSSDAIATRIRFLETLIARLDETRKNLGIFDRRGRARVSGEIGRAQNEITGLRGVQTGSPERISELNRDLSNLNNALARVQGQQTSLNNALIGASLAEKSRARLRFENLEKEELAILSQIDATEKLRDTAVSAFKGTLDALKADVSIKQESAKFTEALAAETLRAVNATKQLSPPIISADKAFLNLIPSLQSAALAVAGFTGELDGVSQPFKSFEVSLVNASKEVDTFARVFTEMEQELEKAEFFASFGEISAHQASLINPAISQAVKAMRVYVAVMDDVQSDFKTVESLSDMVTESVRKQASAFDSLRMSVDGVARSQSGLQGQQISSSALDIFNARTPGTQSGFTVEGTQSARNIAQTVGLEFLREGAFQQTAAEIDTVGESFAAFGDVIGRLAAGDLTALGTAVTRTFSIIDAQNKAFEERRRQRRLEAIDERTTRAFRFGNLEAVGRAAGRDDLSSNDAFAGLRQNLAAGQFDFASGFAANLQRAFDALELDEAIERQLLGLVVNIERAITPADIEAIYDPFLDAFETAMEEAGKNFDNALNIKGKAAINSSLQDYIAAINRNYDEQIEALQTTQRATGINQFAEIQAVNRERADVLNEARLATGTDAEMGRRGRGQALAITRITGESRNILVDSLRDLNELKAIPQQNAILAEIRDNTSVLPDLISRQNLPSLNPNAVDLRNRNADGGIDVPGGGGLGGQNTNTTIVQGPIQIFVENAADIQDVNDLGERLNAQNDFNQRQLAGVFPNNRERRQENE